MESVSFWLGQRIERKKTMMLAAGTMVVGAAVQSSAYTLPHLIIGRILTGIGIGTNSSTIPTYQSELCAKHMRGRLVSAELLFVGVGITIA